IVAGVMRGHRLAASFSSFNAFWEASSLAPSLRARAAANPPHPGTAARPRRLAGQVRREALSNVKEIAMNNVMAMTALAASLLVSTAAIAAPANLSDALQPASGLTLVKGGGGGGGFSGGGGHMGGGGGFAGGHVGGG